MDLWTFQLALNDAAQLEPATRTGRTTKALAAISEQPAPARIQAQRRHGPMARLVPRRPGRVVPHKSERRVFGAAIEELRPATAEDCCVAPVAPRRPKHGRVQILPLPEQRGTEKNDLVPEARVDRGISKVVAR